MAASAYRVLFFVALLIGVAVSEDVARTASQPYVQVPRVFTSINASEEGQKRRDLEEADGAGAGLDLDDKAAAVQGDVFDHVGQKFVRKALNVLDQRLLKAAEAKRKGADEDEDNDDDEQQDDEVEDAANAMLEDAGFHAAPNGADDDDEKQHHDFEKIDEDEEEPSRRRRKAKKEKRVKKEDADLMNAVIKYPDDSANDDGDDDSAEKRRRIQPPLKRNQIKSRLSKRQKIDEELDEADDAQVPYRKRPAASAQPMIPVDLNVNEGVEGGNDVVGKMDNGAIDLASALEGIEAEDLSGASSSSSSFQTPHLGMVGSAAAGVGVMGSAAYCCISRRRSRKHHSSRSDLPMYEPDSSPPSNSSLTPDGYRVRRGLTKYR